MDKAKRKMLMMQYKFRKPEMGIISFHCLPTGDYFLGPSVDTKADINSNSFQLDAYMHPNSELQGLWKRYGKPAFEVGVAKVLPYDEKEPDRKDYAKELDKLYRKCIKSVPHGRAIR